MEMTDMVAALQEVVQKVKMMNNETSLEQARKTHMDLEVDLVFALRALHVHQLDVTLTKRWIASIKGNIAQIKRQIEILEDRDGETT